MDAQANPLPPWRAVLRGAREREGRGPAARWLQLASVAADGTPRLRTLVFRGWGGPAALDLLTDNRSAKARELRAQPAVELCWLLPRARCQFRLRGQLLVLPHELEQQERQRHWHQLNPGGRALWGWPPPGQPLVANGSFPAELAADGPLPEPFQLLRIGLHQVELLQLGSHPHQRQRWWLTATGGWNQEWLNP
ncbi:MAG: pyridoxamine 5'-phosphate oxidase family protein [Cyanobacteriota bacterium]|nr:pyridoxamine 5'-phosphate oxidase family protein [Cyanobacteriota bacterium]